MKDFLKNLKKDLISIEMLLYMAFGTGTAIIDVGLYSLCYSYLPLDYILLTVMSNATAWIGSTVFAFVTNKFFVFKSKHNGKRKLLYEFLTFFSARFFSLIMSLILLILMVDILKWDPLWSKIMSTVFVVITNYIASKAFVFKDSSQNENKE